MIGKKPHRFIISTMIDHFYKLPCQLKWCVGLRIMECAVSGLEPDVLQLMVQPAPPRPQSLPNDVGYPTA
jgi:hypothetical protein